MKATGIFAFNDATDNGIQMSTWLNLKMLLKLTNRAKYIWNIPRKHIIPIIYRLGISFISLSFFFSFLSLNDQTAQGLFDENV